MNSIKRWGIPFIIFVTIPVLGVIISSLVSNGYEKEYEDAIIYLANEDPNVNMNKVNAYLAVTKLSDICAELNPLDPEDHDLIAFCNEYQRIKDFKIASIFVLLFSIACLTLIPILSKAAQRNRTLLFYLFRPALFFIQISSAVLIIANAAILIYGIYIAESFYLGNVHFVLLGFLALVALWVSLSICIKMLIPVKKAEAYVIGKKVSKNEQPAIWEFIESIAKQVDTTPPDSIIVGMDPNFFVTEANVNCLDGKVIGKSLYLSLPFCRVINKDELMSIVGHEMGHFVGSDTKWSRKFYPIYRGSIETYSTIDAFSDGKGDEHIQGLMALASLQSLFLMRLFISSFATAEKEIGRLRELDADSIGAKITSTKIMASSLVKMHVFIHAWQFTREKMKEAITEGKQIINISFFFRSVCEMMPPGFMFKEIETSSTPHPIDSHPTLSVRLNALNVKLSEFYVSDSKLEIENDAIELINNHSEIEEELSSMEHEKLIHSGVATPKIEPALES